MALTPLFRVSFCSFEGDNSSTKQCSGYRQVQQSKLHGHILSGQARDGVLLACTVVGTSVIWYRDGHVLCPQYKEQRSQCFVHGQVPH